MFFLKVGNSKERKRRRKEREKGSRERTKEGEETEGGRRRQKEGGGEDNRGRKGGMDGGQRESERERLKMVLSCLHLKSSSRPFLCGKVCVSSHSTEVRNQI